MSWVCCRIAFAFNSLDGLDILSGDNRMMILLAVILILWLHFIGDFLLQTDEMALNKSHSWKWLSIHALVYGLPFYVVLGLINFKAGVIYALINSILHGLVDTVTSRITARLWAKGERHWFFVVIGLDQVIHYTCLLLSPFVILYVLSLFLPY